jgi:hypothetical protein
MTPCGSSLTQVLMLIWDATLTSALEPACASTPTSRGDKTAIELFRVGVRDNAGPLTKATEALATNCN